MHCISSPQLIHFVCCHSTEDEFEQLSHLALQRCSSPPTAPHTYRPSSNQLHHQCHGLPASSFMELYNKPNTASDSFRAPHKSMEQIWKDGRRASTAATYKAAHQPYKESPVDAVILLTTTTTIKPRLVRPPSAVHKTPPAQQYQLTSSMKASRRSTDHEPGSAAGSKAGSRASSAGRYRGSRGGGGSPTGEMSGGGGWGNSKAQARRESKTGNVSFAGDGDAHVMSWGGAQTTAGHITAGGSSAEPVTGVSYSCSSTQPGSPVHHHLPAPGIPPLQISRLGSMSKVQGGWSSEPSPNPRTGGSSSRPGSQRSSRPGSGRLQLLGSEALSGTIS